MNRYIARKTFRLKVAVYEVTKNLTKKVIDAFA